LFPPTPPPPRPSPAPLPRLAIVSPVQDPRTKKSEGVPGPPSHPKPLRSMGSKSLLVATDKPQSCLSRYYFPLDGPDAEARFTAFKVGHHAFTNGVCGSGGVGVWVSVQAWGWGFGGGVCVLRLPSASEVLSLSTPALWHQL
jgi:hypothetical protein